MTAAARSHADITTLWTGWRALLDGPKPPKPVAALQAVLRQHHLAPAAAELRAALKTAGAAALTDAGRFADVLIPLVADRALRIETAFTYLSPAGGPIPLEALRTPLSHLFKAEQLDAMLAELDADGDRKVTLDDMLAFQPDCAPVAPAAAPAPATAPVYSPRPAEAAAHARGTISPLRMQTGFFRLLQGAAYRTFRESWSANSESHLRARDLPYTVSDFAAFVRAATDFYLSLGIVTGPRAIAEFHKLIAMVEAEHRSLLARIDGWDSATKTDAMLAAEAALEQELAEATDHRRRFAEAVEFLLALRAHGLTPDQGDPHLLTRTEAGRLRVLEMAIEHGHVTATATAGAQPYHDRWTAVILAADQPRRPGTIMPIAFWYDQFMPQLLLCASILTDADLDAQSSVSEAALDQWHQDTAATGAFDRYATDLRDGFAACPPTVKRSLRQAWRLTEHYLNSLQKRRERAEFGRETGFLSQYVSFIDLHLGRSDVADAEMRISFPYFIGPAVWCFLHTAASLIDDMDDTARGVGISAFRAFFVSFATMYPCPYCRYHLNRYVVKNREVNFYPVEFLLLGQKAEKPLFDISIQDRLDAITPNDGTSLRLFVWKLHNAVSSSIERTEEWYHHEEHPLYTTRFWPSLEAEIARMRAEHIDQIAIERIEAIHGVTKATVELATLRRELDLALSRGDHGLAEAIADQAHGAITRTETALAHSRLLEATYRYDAEKIDPPPHLTDAEESYARSNLFVER